MKLEAVKTIFKIVQLALLASLFSRPVLAAAANNNNAEDATIKSESSYPLVVSSNKNSDNKSISFELVDPNDPNQKMGAEFSYSSREISKINDIRVEINESMFELQRQVEFARVFLGFSPLVPPREIFDTFPKLPAEIQKEMIRQYNLKFKTTGKIAKEVFLRTSGNSMHGFGAQTILFSIPIGALMFWQVYQDYASNPMGMIQFFDSLTDPFAHLSFYAFIAANGITTDMLLKQYAGVPGNVLKGPGIFKNGIAATTMRTAIPYLGMSAGMMASNITGELLNLMNTCVKSMIDNKKQEAMMKALSMAKPKQSKDACDVAQEQFFNFDNKVEQYVPMLLSMGLATAGLTYAHKGSAAFGTTRPGNFIKGTKIFQAAKATKGRILLNGFKMFGRLTPAGLVLNGMTVYAVINTMAQNLGFLSLDHFINEPISKVFAQTPFGRAGSLNSIDKKFTESYLENQKNKWTTTKSDEDQDHFLNLLDEFENQLSAWKTINHVRYFNAIGMWTKMVGDLTRELQATENFYQDFIGEIFFAFKSRNIVNVEGKIDGVRAYNHTELPFRTFPLFGMRAGGPGYLSCEVDKNNCKSDPDYYWFNPQDMEQYQVYKIKQIASIVLGHDSRSKEEKEKDDRLAFENESQAEKSRLARTVIPNQSLAETLRLSTQGQANETLNETLRLESKLPTKIQETLNIFEKIEKSSNPNELSSLIIQIDKMFLSREFEQWPPFKNYLYQVRTAMGPFPLMPISAPGLAVPLIYKTLFKEYFEKIPEKKQNGFTFSSYPEFLIYQMICGPDFKDKSSVLDLTKGKMPEFTPPRVMYKSKRNVMIRLPLDYIDKYKTRDRSVNAQVIRDAQDNSKSRLVYMCANLPGQGVEVEIPFKLAFYIPLFDGETSKGERLMDLLSKNISTSVIGDWKDRHPNSKSSVNLWWKENIKTLFIDLFARLDKDFQDLLQEMIEGMNSEEMMSADSEGKMKWTASGRSIFAIANEQLSTYLMILADIERVLEPDYAKNKLKINEKYTILAQANGFLYPRNDSQADIVEAFKPIYKALGSLKPSKGKVQLPLPADQIKIQSVTLKKALDFYRKEWENEKRLTPYQRKIVKLCVAGLERTMNEMTAYLLNTQLTNFSASTAYLDLLNQIDQVDSKNENKKPTRTGGSPRGL
jgi:hypothetical protein